jgi:DNA-binding NtrC family response regulator
MIALFGTDRRWRTALEAALRSEGLQVRTASRPAELAKCLTDGAVRLVISTPDERERDLARRTVGSHALLTTSPGDTMEHIVRRAMALLSMNGTLDA